MVFNRILKIDEGNKITLGVYLDELTREWVNDVEDQFTFAPFIFDVDLQPGFCLVIYEITQIIDGHRGSR
jgi:hypothetical protein